MTDASAPTYWQDFTSIAMNMVEAKPIAIAGLSAAVATAVLGASPLDAFDFGARNAVAVSAVDVILTGMGVDAQITHYVGDDYGKYFNPVDLVAGAVGATGVGYLSGLSGRQLGITVGAAAVSAAVAPLLAGYVVAQLMGLGKTTTNDLKAAGGSH